LLRDLKSLGVTRIVLAAGDRRDVAETMAKGLPIHAVRSELSPDQKTLVVLSERKNGPVMMIGDGVNDAPALAAADLGVAMGAKSAAASAEAADVARTNSLQLSGCVGSLQHRLWHLDRPEVHEERTRIFAREAKCRHIWMTGHQAFAQPLCKRIKLHPAIERAERRRANVRTLAALPDRMACRLLQRAGLAVLSQAARRCEQQKEDDEPRHHLETPPLIAQHGGRRERPITHRLG